MRELIHKLYQTQTLEREELIFLIPLERDEETERYARDLAREVREEVYGSIFLSEV